MRLIEQNLGYRVHRRGVRGWNRTIVMSKRLRERTETLDLSLGPMQVGMYGRDIPCICD